MSPTPIHQHKVRRTVYTCDRKKNILEEYEQKLDGMYQRRFRSTLFYSRSWGNSLHYVFSVCWLSCSCFHSAKNFRIFNLKTMVNPEYASHKVRQVKTVSLNVAVCHFCSWLMNFWRNLSSLSFVWLFLSVFDESAFLTTQGRKSVLFWIKC
jgi:hypothetical protein